MIRLVNRLNLLRSGSRTYLTSSYTCSTAWEARKADCPTLSKINLDQFYADVETKYQQQRKVSAIDVDIFVNCVTADNYVDEMADIIHKLRNTGEASNILDSTSHAVVRSLIQHDQIDLLLQILRDPLNYGLFLDTFCANLLLDKLLEAKQFTEAAEVASLLMLQEDFGDDITRQMALLAAYKYLDNPEAFVKEEPVPEVDKKAAAPPPPPTKGKKGKKEELRVRVKFLRNPFFDDHFDIRDPRHLVGKTLVRLSSELPKNCQTSSKLMGLCLYEKYADCITFIDQLGQGDVLHKDVIEKTQKALESKPSESEEYKNLLEKFTAIAGKVTVDENFERLVNASIKSAIEKLEKETIVGQEKVSYLYNLLFNCILIIVSPSDLQELD